MLFPVDTAWSYAVVAFLHVGTMHGLQMGRDPGALGGHPQHLGMSRSKV